MQVKNQMAFEQFDKNGSGQYGNKGYQKKNKGNDFVVT